MAIARGKAASRHRRFVKFRNKTEVKCSCSLCCNPRHAPYNQGRWKRTLQELKHYDDYADQLYDLEDYDDSIYYYVFSDFCTGR